MNKKLLLILIAPFFIVSCGTTKGYLGKKLPNEELATINGATNAVSILRKKYKEQVLIAGVDSIKVGSFYKGWPKKIKVKPGEHTIEVRHFRPWEQSNIYVIGGAIGGIMQENANKKNNTHPHYLLKFKSEKGQSYTIKIETDPSLMEEPKIEVLNTTSNTTIQHEVEEKITN